MSTQFKSDFSGVVYLNDPNDADRCGHIVNTTLQNATKLVAQLSDEPETLIQTELVRALADNAAQLARFAPAFRQVTQTPALLQKMDRALEAVGDANRSLSQELDRAHANKKELKGADAAKRVGEEVKRLLDGMILLMALAEDEAINRILQVIQRTADHVGRARDWKPIPGIDEQGHKALNGLSTWVQKLLGGCANRVSLMEENNHRTRLGVATKDLGEQMAALNRVWDRRNNDEKAEIFKTMLVDLKEIAECLRNSAMSASLGKQKQKDLLSASPQNWSGLDDAYKRLLEKLKKLREAVQDPDAAIAIPICKSLPDDITPLKDDDEAKSKLMELLRHVQDALKTPKGQYDWTPYDAAERALLNDVQPAGFDDRNGTAGMDDAMRRLLDALKRLGGMVKDGDKDKAIPQTKEVMAQVDKLKEGRDGDELEAINRALKDLLQNVSDSLKKPPHSGEGEFDEKMRALLHALDPDFDPDTGMSRRNLDEAFRRLLEKLQALRDAMNRGDSAATTAQSKDVMAEVKRDAEGRSDIDKINDDLRRLLGVVSENLRRPGHCEASAYDAAQRALLHDLFPEQLEDHERAQAARNNLVGAAALLSDKLALLVANTRAVQQRQ